VSAYTIGVPVLTGIDYGATGDSLSVSVFLDDVVFINDFRVPIGSLGTESPPSISSLPTSLKPRTIRCVATLDDQTFTDTAELLYLPPNPYGGSTVKLDRRSGPLWVRNESANQS
jgi:hypothetical protein